MVQAFGIEVNWAEFGFRQTHPHQSHSEVPRILPEFSALTTPLPTLAIVMPHVDVGRQSPLAARIADHLNKHGGVLELRPSFTGTVENERMRLHMARLDIETPLLKTGTAWKSSESD
ncbi:hypothetical protein KC19_VG174900 [Ceratodon purpureus]|uniref:Uncharacterized protein n=1 Tax=Ceratodon purpureus TaxID=3225 RepID=A0A8T0HR44_CERPU|nr:hypothetical protein KC19_VG174900 [Ceratodon purpureus]